MFVKSTRFKQVCQLLLSLIVGYLHFVKSGRMARLFSITLAFPKLVHNRNTLAQIKNMHYRAYM